MGGYAALADRVELGKMTFNDYVTISQAVNDRKPDDDADKKKVEQKLKDNKEVIQAMTKAQRDNPDPFIGESAEAEELRGMVAKLAKVPDWEVNQFAEEFASFREQFIRMAKGENWF